MKKPKTTYLRFKYLSQGNSFHPYSGTSGTAVKARISVLFQSALKAMTNIIFVISAILLLNGHFVEAASTTRITTGDQWKFYVGVEELSYKWTKIGFDDSNWQTGKFGLGYGGNNYHTFIDNMMGNYQTVFARRDFVITRNISIIDITLSVVCDGPFVAYLNGIEASRNNTQSVEPITLTGFKHELREGQNVLAIQCSNDEIDSDNFLFNATFEVTYE